MLMILTNQGKVMYIYKYIYIFFFIVFLIYYIIFVHVISVYIVVEMKDFKNMVQFFDDNLVDVFKEKLEWNTECGILFLSNNNNPNPWHRDIFSFETDKYPLQFTGLLYLDKTKVTYIAGTHKEPSFNPLKYFYLKKTINVNPGDFVIMYSHLAHHGYYYPNKKHIKRRLMHYFTLFPSNDVSKSMKEITSFYSYNDPKKSDSKNRVKYMDKYYLSVIGYFLLMLTSYIIVALNLHSYMPTNKNRTEIGDWYYKKFDPKIKKIFRTYGSYKYWRPDEVSKLK